MATWDKKFGRPAAIIFSTTALIGVNDYNSATDLILTDHGRGDIQINAERIETAARMIDGTYRSHYITEKKEFSLSWADVPSRKSNGAGAIYTADGFAGGLDIRDYLNNKSQTFYVKFVFNNSPATSPAANPELVYNVMVKSYSYNVKNRSAKFDMMDVNINLVEV